MVSFANPEFATAVNFPGLGLEFNISREAIFIGPLTVYWYGIIVVSGILLGCIFGLYQGKKFGINPDKLSDVLLYSIVAAFVGARIYYVAFSWDYYSQHLDEIIAIWKGGIAFYGGVIGGLLCAYLLCKKFKIPFLLAGDAALGGLLLGQSIGRWGNFANVEAFGGFYEGFFRMTSPAVDSYLHAFPEQLSGFTAEQVATMTNIPVHPTFLYESLWTMLGFLFIVFYTKKRKFAGELTLIYFLVNGSGRAVIEGLRTDSLMIGGFRISQVIAAVMAVAAAVLWIYCLKKVKENTAPAWLTQLSVVEAPIAEENVIQPEAVKEETTEETAKAEQVAEEQETEENSKEI